MKKIIEKIKVILEGKPLLLDVVITVFKTFVIGGCAAFVLFLLLWITKIYPTLETALDLKYNALAILVPLCVFAALSLLCFVVGILMYFHKYSRKKSNTSFRKALESVWKKQ